jgi:hypothetical protein
MVFIAGGSCCLGLLAWRRLLGEYGFAEQECRGVIAHADHRLLRFPQALPLA